MSTAAVHVPRPATAQLTGVALVDVPVAQSGQGSATKSTARQLGSALGIAILGTEPGGRPSPRRPGTPRRPRPAPPPSVRPGEDGDCPAPDGGGPDRKEMRY